MDGTKIMPGGQGCRELLVDLLDELEHAVAMMRRFKERGDPDPALLLDPDRYQAAIDRARAALDLTR